MGKTAENLKAAFAGESQANRKYLAFARKAQEEGHEGVARLFRAAAAAETVHALAHLKVLGGIRTTAENVQTAIEGENYEFTQMYPEFVKQAEEEKNKKASVAFQNANEVEEIHYGLCTEALAALKTGQEFPVVEWFVCPVCGNTVRNEAPEACPICGTAGTRFMKIE